VDRLQPRHTATLGAGQIQRIDHIERP
jgi:hypothetical protein